MPDLSHAQWVAVAIISILSVARTARLIIFDDFPPMVWLRIRLLNITPTRWEKLWECPFCLTPYLMAGMVAWGVLTDYHWTWWLINGIWGLSYVSAVYVVYDQPED